MNEIKLELSVDEINLCLSALGNMPFVQVTQLVEKIRTQALDQIPKDEDNS